jgi:hypothetical protein
VEIIDRTPGTGCDVDLFPNISACNLGGQPQPITGNQQASGAQSSGTVRLYDDEYYPRAQQAEVIFSVSMLVPTNGFRFGRCGDLEGVRILRCSPNPAENTSGTVSLSVTVGSGVFTTGAVAPFCPRGSWVASMGGNPVGAAFPVTNEIGHLMAEAVVRAQWCADNNGHVTKLSILSISPNRKISELDSKTSGNTTPQPFSRNGKTAYELSFDMEYEFKLDYTVGSITFRAGTKCAVAIHLVYTDATIPSVTQSQNPCSPWRPGGN